MEDPNLENIIEMHYISPKQKLFIKEDIESLQRNRLFTLSDWKGLDKEQKKIFPLGLVNILDKGIFQPIKRKEFPTNQKKVF